MITKQKLYLFICLILLSYSACMHLDNKFAKDYSFKKRQLIPVSGKNDTGHYFLKASSSGFSFQRMELINVENDSILCHIEEFDQNKNTVLEIIHETPEYGPIKSYIFFNEDSLVSYSFISPIKYVDGKSDCYIRKLSSASSECFEATINSADTIQILKKLLNNNQIPINKTTEIQPCGYFYDQKFTLLKFFGLK